MPLQFTDYEEYIELMARWQLRLLDLADQIRQTDDVAFRNHYRSELTTDFARFMTEINDLEFRITAQYWENVNRDRAAAEEPTPRALEITPRILAPVMETVVTEGTQNNPIVIGDPVVVGEYEVRGFVEGSAMNPIDVSDIVEAPVLRVEFVSDTQQAVVDTEMTTDDEYYEDDEDSDAYDTDQDGHMESFRAAMALSDVLRDPLVLQLRDYINDYLENQRHNVEDEKKDA